jgi:hypothetical protein
MEWSRIYDHGSMSEASATLSSTSSRAWQKAISGKLLGGGQIKYFSAFSLIAMMTTLGLKCQFVEDPEMVGQMRPHWEQCDTAQRRTCRQARIGKITMARMFPVVSKEIARRGGEARKIKLSPAERSAIARKAGQALGRARLRRGDGGSGGHEIMSAIEPPPDWFLHAVTLRLLRGEDVSLPLDPKSEPPNVHSIEAAAQGSASPLHASEVGCDPDADSARGAENMVD